MFKKITVAALATVSMCAFAGTHHHQSGWNNKDMDAADASMFDQRKALEWHANESLSGSDRFALNQMLNRAPMNVEKALLSGLSKAHRQAVMINEQMLAWRFPAETSVSTTTSSDGTATTTTVTTYDTNSNNWSAMDWSGQEASFRPMRMIMTKSDKPKEISYDQAIEILCSDLGDTSTAILSSWWYGEATEQQKDVVVRLLKDDASKGDQTYYSSVYTHRSYDWTK